MALNTLARVSVRAGGLSTYLHCDAVAGMLPNSDVHCLGDAGLFLDHPSVTGASPYRRDMRYMFDMASLAPRRTAHRGCLCPVYMSQWPRACRCHVFFPRRALRAARAQMNSSGGVNQECLNSKAADLQWMCMFASYSLPHIRTPMFVSNSRFDSWQMDEILGGQAYYGLNAAEQAAYASCVADYNRCDARFKAAVDEWAVAFQGKLAPALANPKDGVFVNNCHRHHNVDGDEAFRTKINGTSLVDAVALWAIEGKPPKLVDSAVPGQNPSC